MSSQRLVIYEDVARYLEMFADEPERFVQLFFGIWNYATTGEQPEDKMLWREIFPICASIDRLAEKEKEITERRRDAGKKGLETRWGKKIANDSKALQTIANDSKALQTIANDSKDSYTYTNTDTNTSTDTITDTEKSKKDTLSCVEKKQKEFDKRKQVFYDDCAKYVQRYGRELVRDFYDYWTEQYQHDAFKMRKDGEKTWNTARRLSTWNKRTIKDNNYGTDRNKTEETNRKAAELLRSGAGAESQTPDF